MLEDPIYRAPRSVFIFPSPYLIFGERGKTVWGSSRIVNFQNIFYIEGELALHMSFQPRIKVLFGQWNLSLCCL